MSRKKRRKPTVFNRPGPPPQQKPAAVPTPFPGKTRVLLSVPTLSGNVNWSIAHQFARAIFMTHDPNHPFAYETLIVSGQRPYEFARNGIVKQFMEAPSKPDWLMMWDDDQRIPDNWPHLLMVTGADIVSGTTYCWVARGEPRNYMRVNQYGLWVDPKTKCERHPKPGFADGEDVKKPCVCLPQCFNLTPPDTKGQPYQVPIAGTGCLAVHRRVFEKLGNHPFRTRAAADGTGRIEAGEDINFSADARQAGFTVAVHPQVVFGHIKPLDLADVERAIVGRAEAMNLGYTPKPEEVLSVG